MQGNFTGQQFFTEDGWTEVYSPGNFMAQALILQPIINYGWQITPQEPPIVFHNNEFESDWRMMGMQHYQPPPMQQYHQFAPMQQPQHAHGHSIDKNMHQQYPMMAEHPPNKYQKKPSDNEKNQKKPVEQERQRQPIFSPSPNLGGQDRGGLQYDQRVEPTNSPTGGEQNLWEQIKNVIGEEIWQVRPHRQSAIKPPPPTNNWFEDLKQTNASKIIPPQKNNLKQFLDQQVSFLEPSPIDKKLQQLRRNGERFLDEVFPPNLQSLSGQWGPIKKWESIKWRRISEIIKKPVIFQGKKVEPKDIKQGQLGNCYFLAALAALAERPERIFNLFLVFEENAQKYYACKILYKGKWKTIDLDEYIPTIGDSPAFSKAVGQELWVILLEKAWAKLYSSYKRIESGYGEEGIHNLTGAHMHAIRFQAKDFDKEKEWQYLMRATRHGYCMIASSQPGSDRNKALSGIVLGHAYTVIGAYEVQYHGRLVSLIKLRNPWGKGESVISWCDQDKRWNDVSAEEKKRIGFDGNPNDGVFFQAYDDFIKDFRILNVAEVNDEASYVYHVQRPKKRKGCYFKVSIFKEGKYSFQLNQTPDRAYQEQHQKMYKYQPATLLIGRVEGKLIEYYEGSQSAYRTLFKKHRLPPGEYIVFAKIAFNEQFEMDYEVTLAIYGDYVCEVTECPTNEIGNFKEKLFMNRARRVKSKEVRPGVWTAQEILKEGYIYFACWNRSGDTMALRLKVQPNPNPTVTLKKPFKGKNIIEAQIHPKQDFIVLARVGDYSHPTGGLGSAEMTRVKH